MQNASAFLTGILYILCEFAHYSDNSGDDIILK